MDSLSDLRQERLTKAREILLHQQFLSLPPEKQEEILNTLLSRGLRQTDLEVLLNERHNETTSPFRILDKGALSQILLTLDPRSILALCRTDKRFSNLCRDQSFFKRLLALHYPLAFVTDNPRRQYVALASGVETIYRMDRLGNDFTEFKNPVQIAPSSLPEDVQGWSVGNMSFYVVKHVISDPAFDEWLMEIEGPESQETKQKWLQLLRQAAGDIYDEDANAKYRQILTPHFKKFIAWVRANPKRARYFTLRHIVDLGKQEMYKRGHYTDVVFPVPGISIPPGTQAWALIWQSHTAGLDDEVTIYKTKEDLARQFVKNNYQNLVDTLVRGGGFESFIYEWDGEDAWEQLGFHEMTDETLMETDLFQRYLVESNVPLKNFTEEGLYEYALTHDEFHLYPESDRDWWLFRQVTF